MKTTQLVLLLVCTFASPLAADDSKIQRPVAETDSRLYADGKGWRLDQAKIGDTARPRVLLIGDSILNGYFKYVVKSLDGMAYVDAWVNPYHQSAHVNKLLADVLEHGPYDVVHFNMGLHGWAEGRIKPGTFEPLTKAYVDVLRRKLPEAKLLWASSTPVTAKGQPTELDREINPVIIEHNRMAAVVMKEMDVPINDFYSLLIDKRELARGDRFHWTEPAYKLLADQIVRSIVAALPTASPPLEVTSPLDYEVIQRKSREQGTVRLSGRLPAASPSQTMIEARLVIDGQDTAWQKLKAELDENAFQASLAGPSGGWHRLEVRAVANDRVIGEAAVEHVGIGELFVVAGQSNSANHGEERQLPKSDRVVAFDGTRWQPALDPQPGASGSRGSFLPPFGDAMVARFDVPVGFIACGIGATSVREWLPKGVAFPHPPTIERRVEKLPSGEWASNGDAFATLVSRMKSAGPNGFRAVLWHQGESDANQKDATRTLPGELYAGFLKTLMRTSGREIGWDPPWFVAKVSYHGPGDEGSPDIREAQASVWRDGTALEGPDSDALQGDLRERNGQGVHFSGKGLREHAAKWADKVSPWLESQLKP